MVRHGRVGIRPPANAAEAGSSMVGLWHAFFPPFIPQCPIPTIKQGEQAKELSLWVWHSLQDRCVERGYSREGKRP